MRPYRVDGIRVYPVMKPSGVEWMGKVPVHWKVRLLRTVLKSVTERNHPELALLSVVREKGVILRDLSDLSQNRNFIPDDLRNYKVVKVGQFAMNKMKAWQGSYGVSKHDGIVSPAYYVFDLQRVSGDYFHSAIRSKAYVPFFTQASDGVRIGQWDLSQVRMREIPFFVPPLPEQHAIARFLDHADRRIRRYIRAKERLIELLEEQKKAIIHQAVTGQIDVRTGKPYPTYKDSGVEWLGKVPEHWEVRPLKFLTNIPSGQIDPRVKDHRHKPLIAPNHIPAGGGRLLKIETAAAQGADSGKYEVRAGDVVYSKIRPHLRKAVISPFDGLCSADMYPMRVKKYEITDSFFLQLLLSKPVTKYAVDCSMRVAMPKINRQALGDCRVAYPCLKAQEAIVNHISSHTGHLDTAVTLALREVELLNEYRTRLIADVVTGKIDVREVAVNLPDEGDVLKPLDALEN